MRTSVIDFAPISERVVLVKLAGQPLNIKLIQADAPTVDKTDEEVMNFYGNIKYPLMLTKNDINIIMGEFNATIGKRRCDDIVSNFGLSSKNERGEILIDLKKNHSPRF